MKIRTALVAALAVAVSVPAASIAAPPRPATPKALVFEDPAGDANAINDQGTGAPVPAGQATPVQAGAFDIRSVKVVTDKAGAAATKLIVTLTLAEAPSPGGLYRVLSDVGGCVFWTEYSVEPDASLNGSYVRVCDEAALEGYAYHDATGKIDGSSIIWTIPMNQFKAQGIKPGALLGSLGADARVSAVAVTFPSVDGAASDLTYKIGS